MKIINKTKEFFANLYQWISKPWRKKQLPIERTIHVPAESYYFMERLSKHVERKHRSLFNRIANWVKTLFK